jgi:hypothetical protein
MPRGTQIKRPVIKKRFNIRAASNKASWVQGGRLNLCDYEPEALELLDAVAGATVAGAVALLAEPPPAELFAGLAAPDAPLALGVLDALFAPDSPAPLGSAVFAEGSAVFVTASPDFLVPLSRKSVTYQPEPFSTKPGAVNCLEK